MVPGWVGIISGGGGNFWAVEGIGWGLVGMRDAGTDAGIGRGVGARSRVMLAEARDSNI